MGTTTATLTGDALRPPRARGMGAGAVLAFAVHVALVLVLALGVRWHASEPTGMSAELWAAVPQVAAPAAREVVAPPPPPAPAAVVTPKVEPKPPPPAPAPLPREAEIALEKAKVELAKAEKARAELAKAEKAKAEKIRAQAQAEQAQRERKLREEREAALAKADALKREQAEQQRLDKQREDNVKRLLGQAGATGAPSSTGTAARDAGPSASYAGRIVARVRPNIVFTDTLVGTPKAEVEVRSAPDGTIIARRLVKASGNKSWDDAVLRAIDRTEVLPRDVDGRVPATMTLVFEP